MVRPLGSVALLLLTFAAACGKSEALGKTPSGARASCASDSDCVLTTTTSCCSCCPNAPAALPKEEQERKESECARVSCKPCDEKIECAKVESIESFVAKCKDGACAAVHK